VHLWNSYNFFTDKPVEMFALTDQQRPRRASSTCTFRYTEILIRAPHMRDKLGIFPCPRP